MADLDVELQRTLPDGTRTSWPLLADASEPVTSRDRMAYHCSVEGGQLGYNLTSDVVDVAAAGEQPLAALVNPDGSTWDLWFHLGEFGSGSDALFRRHPAAATDLTGLTNPRSPRNLTGGTTASPMRMYAGGDFTAPPSQVPSKTAHIGAFRQYTTELRGITRLRPGRALWWSIENASGGVTAFTGTVYFEFWMEPAR